MKYESWTDQHDMSVGQLRKQSESPPAGALFTELQELMDIKAI